MTNTYRLEDEENFESLCEEYFGIVDIKCYGGSPVEINGTQWPLLSEVEDWLSTQVDDFEYDLETTVISFKNPTDAMMFKLAWL